MAKYEPGKRPKSSRPDEDEKLELMRRKADLSEDDAVGITDEDRSEFKDDENDATPVISRGLPAQNILAKEMTDRAAKNKALNRRLDNEVAPIEQPTKSFATQLRTTVNAFKAAPAGAEKERHRVAAWSMVEGIKRDSVRGENRPTADDPTRGGRRTKISFVDGQEMPCVNGRCHNTVQHETPDTEAPLRKGDGTMTQGVTSCANGKCNIPSAVAPRPAER
jgi:hypothetical protein